MILLDKQISSNPMPAPSSTKHCERFGKSTIK